MVGVFALVITYAFYSLYVIQKNNGHFFKNTNVSKNTVEYKALPESKSTVKVNVAYVDVRIEILDEFFNSNKSPLSTHSQDIIASSDKHDLDFRLLPAIAMHESALCKILPKDSHNCWGFGIYGDKVTRFKNYPEAIETVAKTLAKEYIAKGYKDPYEIMKKYTPTSNGSWAIGVSSVMKQLSLNL